MDLTKSPKLALVCGSSDGLGLACAAAFAEGGASVILTGRNEAKLVAALATLRPGKHHKFVCDFENQQSVNELIAFVESLSTPISILVNNSGGPGAKAILSASIEDFENAMRAHLYTSHLLCQFVVPQMKKANFGRIINIVSVSGKNPIEMLGVSNTVRGAVLNWSKTLSLEVAKFGITVNNILPGYTETNRLKGLADQISTQRGVDPDAVRQKWISETPVGRLGTTKEFGALAAFLASDASSFMTGTSIPIDGGWLRGV